MLWFRVAPILLSIAANTLFHATPLLLAALLKALVPVAAWRRAWNPVLTGLASNWIAVNSAMMALLTRTQFVVELPDTLRGDGHYLVLANHQSWVDIVVLQKVFNRRIPFLRFFLKRQLFWVPVLGLCWWALDFPFMGRYSRQQIARRPELGERDRLTVRRACAKFREIPVSVMNFVEGTRFTPHKHAAQGPAYRHLLKPKSGGIAFVIDAMGDTLHTVLDTTIVYPGGRPSMIDLMADRVPAVHIRVRERDIPADLIGGDYTHDAAYRERFQQWINGLWDQKDDLIADMLRSTADTKTGERPGR